MLTKQAPLEREKAEIENAVNGMVVSFYKSTKLLVKTVPADLEKMNGADQENTAKLKLLVFALGLQTVNTSYSYTLDSLTSEDLMSLYQIFNEIREKMATLKEDDLPPMLPALAYLSAQAVNISLLLTAVSAGGHIQGIDKFMINPQYLSDMPRWTNNYEHALLASLMAAKVAPAPSSCGVYEAYMTDIETLDPDEYKVLCAWIKAIVYMQNEWNYSTEEILTQILLLIEKKTITPKSNFSFLTLIPNSSKQTVLDDLKTITHLLRGLSRIGMNTDEKRKEGIEDFHRFLERAKETGLDNELILSLEVYLDLEAENIDQAVAGLQKLQGSKWIGKNEKAIIDQTINYLNERNTEAAFNYFSDRFFIISLISTYAFDHFQKTEMYANLQNAQGGKLLMEFPTLFSKAYQTIVPTDKIENAKDKVLKLLE